MKGDGRFSKALERAAAVAAIWPLGMLLTSGRFRQRWPCLAGRLALLLGAYSVSAAAVIVFLPAGLWLLLAVTAVALVYERWNSRPMRGVANDLPPGSLTFAPMASTTDPAFLLSQAEKHGSVFKQRSLGAPGAFGTPTICVIGHDSGLRLLRDHGDAIRTTDDRRWTPFANLIPRGFIRYMDDDDHAHYRNVLRSVLGPRVVIPNLPFLEAAARRVMARMAEAVAADGRAGARPRDYMYDFTLEAFVGLFYGIGPDTPRYAELQKQYGIFHLRSTNCAEVRKRESAFAPILAIVRSHGEDILHAIAKEGPERVSVLSEILRVHDEALDDPTLMGNLICMVETGRTDVGGLLIWIFKMLADNPIWVDRVRDDLKNKAGPAENPLVQRIIKEVLRLEQSEYVGRRITKDVAFDGFTFPKGSMLRICVREGHRNPAVFENPDAFDPDRFLARTYSTSEYAPLGLDGHGCLGSHFIDAAGGALIEVLARDYGLEKTGDGEHWFGPAHLEPSLAFRVRLTPRAAA